jgi:hypothetical protein
MIDEASDEDFRSRLNALVEQLARPSVQMKLKDKRLVGFSIDPESFDMIKVQLRALGLITKSQKSRSLKDTGTYWALTPYGDTVMTNLLAIFAFESSDSNAPSELPITKAKKK